MKTVRLFADCHAYIFSTGVVEEGEGPHLETEPAIVAVVGLLSLASNLRIGWKMV